MPGGGAEAQRSAASPDGSVARTRTSKAARAPAVSSQALASLKGLRATDGIPEELGGAAVAAPHERAVADASAMVARAARRLSGDSRPARRAAAKLETASPAARTVQGGGSAPPISRSEVGEMVSRRIAEELTTISAPAPGVHRSALRRQIDAQLAREAAPSTQQKASKPGQKDIEDAFRRAVRRIFKEEQIRGERDLTPFG